MKSDYLVIGRTGMSVDAEDILDSAYKEGYAAAASVIETIRLWLLENHGAVMLPKGALTARGTVYLQAQDVGWGQYNCPVEVNLCADHTILAHLPDSKKRKTPSPVQKKPEVRNEHADMMRFFFQRGPTDPKTLPPAPRAVGRTYDSIWDD